MPEPNSITAPSISTIADLIRGHYREEISLAVKTGLAVIASLSLKGRDHCLVLVFEGGSGRGKSIIVRVLMSDRPRTEAFLERADDFTPASFVSHSANHSAEELAEIDLLPRIKGKVMLTKELAPLFRDDEKVLRQNFARLTSVLDGDGYRTNSGVHGARGYIGRYVFNWIGATTPIPQRTHEVMSQLGNRILFYEVAGEDFSEEELMEFAENYGSADAVEGCRKITNDFIEAHFRRHPVDSVEARSIAMPQDLLRELVRYAELISHGRVEIFRNGNGDLEPSLPEGPQRIILLLQTVAKGLALLEGRTVVTSEDLEVIRHIAFSSIPQGRRELLQAVLGEGGNMNARQVDMALDTSRPTTINRMKELGATGICEFTPGTNNTSTPGEIALAQDWEWLLDATTPLNDSGMSAEAAEVMPSADAPAST
jgi:hypothetical protein